MDTALIKGLTDSGILNAKEIKINRDVIYHEQISHDQKPLSSQKSLISQSDRTPSDYNTYNY